MATGGEITLDNKNRMVFGFVVRLWVFFLSGK